MMMLIYITKCNVRVTIQKGAEWNPTEKEIIVPWHYAIPRNSLQPKRPWGASPFPSKVEFEFLLTHNNTLGANRS